jgi:hypothetical protein
MRIEDIDESLPLITSMPSFRVLQGDIEEDEFDDDLSNGHSKNIISDGTLLESNTELQKKKLKLFHKQSVTPTSLGYC